MKNRRKCTLLVVLTAIGIAFGIAGCGNEKESTIETENQDNINTVTSDTENQENANDVTIGTASMEGVNCIDAGMEAIRTFDYEGAVAYFEEAVKKGDDLRQCYRGLGIAYMGMTRYDTALENLVMALSCGGMNVDDIDYDICYYEAVCRYKLGDYKEAADIYSSILDLEPKKSDAYYLRGVCELAQNKLTEATADFDQSILLDKKNYGLYIDIYSSLDANGYTDEGKAYLTPLLENEKLDLSSYDLGRLNFYLGDYEKARNYLEKAKEDKTGDSVLLLGKTYEALGEYYYAGLVYEGYLETAKDSMLYNRLGICKMKQDLKEEALSAFRKGKECAEGPTLQTLRFNEIVTCEKLGQFTEAKQLMKQYTSDYPGDLPAAREMIFLETR